jgi:PDZ domain-containing secreted protein
LFIPLISQDKPVLLDNIVIKTLLNYFFANFMNKLSDKQYVLFLFRIGYVNGSYATFEKTRTMDKFQNIDELVEELQSVFDFWDDIYKNEPINEITLDYQIKNKDPNKTFIPIIKSNKPGPVSGFKDISKYKFPNNIKYIE